MIFDVKDTVALISGGVSGLGLQFAKELLRNGARGVAIADINDHLQEDALSSIEQEFGPKAIFIKTDVTKKDSYENAFEKTIEAFKNLDIVINCAGVYDDTIWETEIDKGTIQGTCLAIEKYVKNHKTGSEGVIVNIASIVGLKGSAAFPVYSASKWGVIGLGKSFGLMFHYNRTKIKVLTLCPGLTLTPMTAIGFRNRSFRPHYEEVILEIAANSHLQSTESVSEALIDIIKNAPTGTVWVVENDERPYEYIHSPKEIFATNNNNIKTTQI